MIKNQMEQQLKILEELSGPVDRVHRSDPRRNSPSKVRPQSPSIQKRRD